MERQLKRKPLGPAPIASFEDPNAEPSRMDTSGAADNQPPQRLANIRERGTPTMSQSSTTASIISRSSSPAASTAATIHTHISHQHQPPTHPQPSTAAGSGSGKKPTAAATAHKPLPAATAVAIEMHTAATSAASASASAGAKLRVHATATPRIDISRASSSSHHEDSRDSSPENVFEQVGTGTLQDDVGPRALGFEEEGTVELRNSTEELYFMDPRDLRQEAVAEREKTSTPQVVHKSPIMFKFDELQACLQQNARKDSASSEVAALLCISGRTSRISSVGSQGSAVSRLSAVSAMSAISRSPSPHRMLMETSFCGPKPLENAMTGMVVDSAGAVKSSEILEQVLLSRKHDPTQAILADGVRVTGAPKVSSTAAKDALSATAASNGHPDKPARKQPTTHLTAAPAPSTSTAGKTLKPSRSPVPRSANASPSTVVGVTPAGTDYIRINLKPDHLYTDQGVAPNERVIEEGAAGGPSPAYSGKKPPATLSLKQGRRPDPEPLDAITKHPQQPGQRLNPTASPKMTRHIALRDAPAGSRSPSPSTLGAIVSRKNSICSLFRGGGGKEVSPAESPSNGAGRDRSRSKSRESDSSLTPSKQNSILAIFKPGRGQPAGKSKTSSPVDPEAQHTHVAAASSVAQQPPRPKSRLRYYDSPPDGKSIHIPLHTPPEEREDAALCTVEVIKERRQQSDFRLQRPERNGAATSVAAAPAPVPLPAPTVEAVQIHHHSGPAATRSPVPGKSKPVARRVAPPHVPQSDGSIRIPLRSPTAAAGAGAAIVDAPSMRSFTQPSKVVGGGVGGGTGAAVISTQAPSQARAAVDSATATKCSPSARQSHATVAVSTVATLTGVGGGSQSHHHHHHHHQHATPSKQPPQPPQPQMSTFKPKPTVQPVAPKLPRQQQITTTSPIVHQQPAAQSQVVPISQRPVPPTPTSITTTTTTTPSTAHAAAAAAAASAPAAAAATVSHISTTSAFTTTTTTAATAPPVAQVATATAAAAAAIVTSKERKRILFTTKIGSGSEEQLFATQLSLSKTESLCSQLSEQASILDSPNGCATPSNLSDAHIQSQPQTSTFGQPQPHQPPHPQSAPASIDAKLFEDAPISVTMRVRDSLHESPQRRPLKSKLAHDLSATGNIRHSRYIENIDVILDKQKELAEAAAKHKLRSQPPPLERTASVSSTVQTPQHLQHQQLVQQELQSKQQAYSSAEEVSVFEQSESVCTVRPATSTSTTASSDPVATHRRTATLSAMSSALAGGGSSESERDSELDPSMRQHLPVAQRDGAPGAAEEESTGLVVAQESSFEDELPYVPTTLPEERSHLVSLIPVKERAMMEVRTCPLDRPRSTTPLNPSCLEAYCGAAAAAVGNVPSPFDEPGDSPDARGTATDFQFARGEKLRISLPRKGSRAGQGPGGAPGGAVAGPGMPAAGAGERQPSKSPRRTSNTSGRSWFEFAEQGLGGGGGGTPTSATFGGATFGSDARRPSNVVTDADASPPPPLPPRKTPHNVAQWINFENIPEKRKPPKRITTLPSKEQGGLGGKEKAHGSAGAGGTGDSGAGGGGAGGSGPQYSYVNPDECQCECHESERDSVTTSGHGAAGGSAGSGGRDGTRSSRRNSSQNRGSDAEAEQRYAASASSEDADTKTEHISRRKT